MSVVTAAPGRLLGTVAAPPSKSYTHRALVAAFLAEGPVRVERPLDALDTRRTAEGLRRLGAQVTIAPAGWVVHRGRTHDARRVRVSCGESGTTLRFLTALAAAQSRTVEFDGAPGLARRPMGPLLDALESAGATVDRRAVRGHRLFSVSGPIRPSSLALDPSQSSQFLSALLLVLPSLAGASRIRLTAPEVSRPYVAATVATLRAYGVRVHRRGPVVRVPGPQRYRGSRFRVPGDASSAAYLWAGAAVSGGDVRVQDVPARWPQADRAILPVLRRAGARVTREGTAVRVRARRLSAFSVDLTGAPDLYPLLGAVAAVTPGTSRLLGAAQVVHKESDRRAGTVRLVRALGGTVRVHRTGLAIRGRRPARRLVLSDLTDHRMVMSAAVGALAARSPSVLGDAVAVEKSFPEFWTTFGALRRDGEVSR